MLISKGDKVSANALLRPELSRPVRFGTAGEVLAVRQLPDDPVPLALVKFQGHQNPISVEQAGLTLIRKKNPLR